MDTASQDAYAVQLAKLFPPQGKWTEEDYFALPETNHIVEISGGVLVIPPVPTYAHQRTVGAVYSALKRHVDSHDLGTAVVSPLTVRLWEGTIREPDVLFYRKEHRDRIGERWSEPPDWVAEVVLPGTKNTDEVDKLAEYAKAGIPEYWLVDIKDMTIRVYALRGGEVYTLVETYRAGEIARSETIAGFEVMVDRVM